MDSHCTSQNISSVVNVNEDVAISYNKDIILPNCTDLDWLQIIYAINYKRILFIKHFQTWSSFHSENYENAVKYIDYTPEELCYRFLQRVLPNIFEYELTEDELKLLNLLDLHPNFVKIRTGFKIVDRREILFPADEAAIKSLLTTEVSQNGLNFVGSEVKFNSQIVAVGTIEERSVSHNFNFNAENAALLSVSLCLDVELPNCELLTIKDIFKRLKAAKGDFENTGTQLENVNISLDDLLKKVHTVSQLKKAVAKLVDSNLRRQNIDN